MFREKCLNKLLPNLTLKYIIYNKLSRRPPVSLLPKTEPCEIIGKYTQQVSKPKDFVRFRNAVLSDQINNNLITTNNFDLLLMNHCAKNSLYKLAQQYIEYLKSNNLTLNLASTGKYFRVLASKNSEKYDENIDKEIVGLYEELKKKYPVLDSITLEQIILALCTTKNWKDCLGIIEEIKKSSAPTNSAYTCVAAAAFTNKENDLAWKLMDDIIDFGRVPGSEVYVSYLNALSKLRKNESILEGLETLLIFLQNNNLILPQDVAVQLSHLATKKLNWKVSKPQVHRRGQCSNCGLNLQKLPISPEEFKELKSKFMQNCIIGKDVFIKTNPEELKSFKKFVDKMPSFDVVLDGLNIAYSSGSNHAPAVFAGLVALVLSYFVERGKRVLLLGRAHMNTWPKHTLNYLKNNCTIFLAEDISQDDPYLLYCALNSGQNTIIVTRDLMRGHKFLLEDERLKILFKRWLNQRQYQFVRLRKDNKPIFKIPLPYSAVPQKLDNIWHVPFKVNQSQFDDITDWYCIKQ